MPPAHQRDVRVLINRKFKQCLAKLAAPALDAFAGFMRDLVARYSVPPYNIKYWEIWNEEDVDPSLVGPTSGFGCWGDATDPYYGGGGYAEFTCVPARNAIKMPDGLDMNTAALAVCPVGTSVRAAVPVRPSHRSHATPMEQASTAAPAANADRADRAYT